MWPEGGNKKDLEDVSIVCIYYFDNNDEFFKKKNIFCEIFNLQNCKKARTLHSLYKFLHIELCKVFFLQNISIIQCFEHNDYKYRQQLFMEQIPSCE